MGRDHDIQVLEKMIEKQKTHEAKIPYIRQLMKLDPKSKLIAAHKKGGDFYLGEDDSNTTDGPDEDLSVE